MEPDAPISKNQLTIPLAIVLAGILIAAAIFLRNVPDTTSAQRATETPAAERKRVTIAIRPVAEAEHLRGNPDASIHIVEYSDTECPFCKGFHDTMRQVIGEYGKSGKVAWTYRHFPLTGIHPRAPKEAEATECAAELGGNAKFWEYVDELFRVTPANNGLNPDELPRIADRVGLSKDIFTACLATEKHRAKVDADLAEAVQAGGTGTPFNVILLKKALSKEDEERLREINQEILAQLQPGTPDPILISASRNTFSIGGAFQYPLLKEIIDFLLN